MQSGLVVQRDNGEVVDRFRNRLMVPICRDTGSVIAFGGRAMDADQRAEVPELAGDADLLEEPDAVRAEPDEGARSGRSGFAVLVEGYFDFAQVFQTEAAPVGRLLRHGADAAAGAAAAPVHVEGRAQLRPGRRRSGRRRAVVRAAGRRGLRRQRRGAATRARIRTRSSGGTGAGRVPGAAAQLAAVSRVPARPGRGGPRFRRTTRAGAGS